MRPESEGSTHFKRSPLYRGLSLCCFRRRSHPPQEDYLLGVDPNGKSADYFASLKDFWLQFFAEAGAQVRSLSIDRQVLGL
jgi:hypothetical protein